MMIDDWKSAVFALLFVAYFVGLGVLVTHIAVQESEREYVCIMLGYESYDTNYESCSSGSNPIILRPYESVFGVE